MTTYTRTSTLSPFHADRKIFRKTLAQELDSPVPDPQLVGVDDSTLCTINGVFIDPDNHTFYSYKLQIQYFHDIGHVPHGFGAAEIRVFDGAADPDNNFDDTAVLCADRDLINDLKAHWGEAREHSDAAEVARICARNIKQRIKTNGLVRPRF